MKHILILALVVAGCSSKPTVGSTPCDVALAPGNDSEIARLQTRVRQSANPVVALEQLGWAYIAKARASFDAGYYNLAEQTARCIEDKAPGNLDARLLRGHALHSLHKFREAEAVARELVAQRGRWFDYALLGDALMEQGRLDEAIPAYQAMMDEKPGPQAYARAAHIRWLKGDLAGAIELMRMAGDDPWMRTRLAFYEFQAGNTNVSLPDNFPPAMLLRGRISHDIAVLQRAAQITMLPEYLWALADEQRAAGLDARPTEELLRQHGADDPRTYSLFLATRGTDVPTALRLAQEELKTRADVFTLDALAWAWHAAGNQAQAASFMKRALAEGTQDARLRLHAHVILGRPLDFRTELLLPSERKHLTQLEARK